MFTSMCVMWLVPSILPTNKVYKLRYYKRKTIILNEIWKLTKQLLGWMNCIFEKKNKCEITYYKILNISTNCSELKYCIYGLFLESMNIHIILEQLQTHRCQKAEIWQVLLNYYCQLTNCCVLVTSTQTLQILIRYVFWSLYIAECGMLF
jgi:hypothetical protein